MLKIKTALRSIPRINEAPFDAVQEGLNGISPTDSNRKKYDTGKPRLTFPDLSGMGPNDIVEKGDKSSMDGVSSGYNKGLDPGGQANDETVNVPQTDSSYNEQAFRSEHDLSTNLLMNQDSKKRDKLRSNFNKIYNLPDIRRSSSWNYGSGSV